jgi:hypothetical protein
VIPGIAVQPYGHAAQILQTISLTQPEIVTAANPRPRNFSLAFAQSIIAGRSKAGPPKAISAAIGQAVSRSSRKVYLSFLSPLLQQVMRVVPSYYSAGTFAAIEGVTSITAPLPTQCINGNVLIAFGRIVGGGSTVTVADASWQIVDNYYDGSAVSLWAWRLVDGTQQTPTFAAAGNSFNGRVQVVQVSSANPKRPFGSYTHATAGAGPITGSSIATGGPNNLVLVEIMTGGSATIPTPTGYNLNSSTAGAGAGLSALTCSQTLRQPGSSTPWSVAYSTAGWSSFAVEINLSSNLTFARNVTFSQPQYLFVAGPQAAAFLARTSGLDSTHINAYTALINGLAIDGVWNKLDVLYVFATADSTTASLNLINTSFGAVLHGSPTFTADRGFTGVDGSSTVYIDTGYTASTSGQWNLNSGHISGWCVTNVQSTSAGGTLLGYNGPNTSGTPQTNIIPRYSDGNAYFRVNDSPAPPSSGTANASSIGHWVASRTGSNATAGYHNGSAFLTPNAGTGTVPARKILVLAADVNGTVGAGTSNQMAMASIGAGLTSGDVSNFYSRLRTYMTAVGVP